MTKVTNRPEMKKLTLLLPEDYVSILDELVIDYKTGSRGRCIEVMIDKLTKGNDGK